jgi:hypothetical protein
VPAFARSTPRAPSVAAWLADLGDVPPVSPGAVADARAHVAAAARRAVIDVAPDLLPLRMPKRRMTAVLRCPRLAQLDAARGPLEPTPALLVGRMLDVAIARVVAGRVLPADPERLVADVVAALAIAGDTATVTAIEAALADGVPLGVDLAERARAMAGAFAGVGADAWARTQEQVQVTPCTTPAGDPAVVLRAAIDVSFGAPTAGAPPRAVLEVKSGPMPIDHVVEPRWYALLLALAEGAPPRGVATWAPRGTDDPAEAPPEHGRLAPAPVHDGTLTAAARQCADALVALGRLAAGDRAERRPGWWCGACPERSVCPEAAARSRSAERTPVDDDLDPFDHEPPEPLTADGPAED